ncbi:hypothetical protein GY45DRAFT_315599 [Cubamyces sp. BRFM 1775]|nr:hypothetical protein GY45DRAFT_315599 [Cubamyces sp. BRFM 1775]
MGQRHQVFVIARVRSSDGTSAHRCAAAAYHHQWCYETAPLIYTSRCMDLLSSEENAAVAREEVAHLDGKYQHPSEGLSMPRRPCPYTLFLIGTA